MMKHDIEYFLDKNITLCPDDSVLGEVASSDWWQYLKPLWDESLWLYFGNRMVFVNDRFPIDNDEKSYNNIMRSFIINLKNKARNYDRLFNVYMMDYNPLWNVDGVTGNIIEDVHTGSATHSKTGDDTINLSGSDTNTNTGTTTDTESGSDTRETVTNDDLQKTGTEATAKTGSDTTTRQVATFDSNDNFVNESKDVVGYDSTDTTTYNTSDEHDVNSTDTMEYGKVDTIVNSSIGSTTYGRQDKTSYNSQDAEVRNLHDKHVELSIKQGNQGVTMTQQMYREEVNQWRDNMNVFVMQVLRDCVNLVSYAVEGV